MYKPSDVPPFDGNRTVEVVSEGYVVGAEHDKWVLISRGFLQSLYNKARYFKDVESGVEEEPGTGE